MSSGGFAAALIVGIVLFVTGTGGWLAHGLMGVGAVGLVFTAFAGAGRR